MIAILYWRVCGGVCSSLIRGYWCRIGAETEQTYLAQTIARVRVLHFLDKDFNCELVIFVTVAVIFILFLSGEWHRDRNSNCGVPHWLMLVFLRGIRRTILLPMTSYNYVALCELGKRLSSQFSLENVQLESALASLHLCPIQVTETRRRLLTNFLLRLYHIIT